MDSNNMDDLYTQIKKLDADIETKALSSLLDDKVKEYAEMNGCGMFNIDGVEIKKCGAEFKSAYEIERNKRISTEKVAKWEEEYTNKKARIDEIENSIESQRIYNRNLNDLTKSYFKEYKGGLDVLKNEYHNNKIAYRMASFYNEDKDKLKGMKENLQKFYLLIFIILIGSLIFKKSYVLNNKSLLIFPLIVMIIPLFLRKIVNIILNAFTVWNYDIIYLIGITLISMFVLLFYVSVNIV